MAETLTITVDYRVPSVNAVLAAGRWGQYKIKKAIQGAMLSALRATESESAIPTIFLGNGSSTAYASLLSYLMIDRKTSLTKSRKKKSPTKSKRKPS